MKSSRNYPVYTVNKHAEGLLVGGHPWVYENDILGSPEAEPENGTLVEAKLPVPEKALVRYCPICTRKFWLSVATVQAPLTSCPRK